MIEPKHLLEYVIQPVLKDLGLWSENAERLVLGTACQESECGRWLKQLGDGPARGIYQMEPATHDDIWVNYLEYHPELQIKVENWVTCPGTLDYSTCLVGNLYYATAMCRVHYWRVPEDLPSSLLGQAAYWKRYYNTYKGKGTVEQYIENWNEFVGGAWWV